MAIDLPNNPSIGDKFTSNGRTWQWNGTAWISYGHLPDPTILKVDAVNNLVGINNATPSYTLDVGGDVNLSGNITVGGSYVGLSSDAITDADGDTKIQVEESADEDVIRFDVAGAEKAFINSTGLTVSGDIEVTGSYVGLSSDSITDADGDTKIQVEESADEDTIRFDTAGIERMTIGSTGLVSIPGDLTVTGTLTSSIDTGPIIQMVVATTTTQTVTTSTTYVDTTLSASITPTSASSDIYVLMTGHVRPRRTSADNSGWGYMNIVRGSTQIAETASRIDVGGTGTTQQQSPAAVSILDSPATTSATTYKVQIKSSSPAETAFSGQGFASTITLIEVAN